jgi:hypothetical protein
MRFPTGSLYTASVSASAAGTSTETDGGSEVVVGLTPNVVWHDTTGRAAAVDVDDVELVVDLGCEDLVVEGTSLDVVVDVEAGPEDPQPPTAIATTPAADASTSEHPRRDMTDPLPR